MVLLWFLVFFYSHGADHRLCSQTSEPPYEYKLSGRCWIPFPTPASFADALNACSSYEAEHLEASNQTSEILSIHSGLDRTWMQLRLDSAIRLNSTRGWIGLQAESDTTIPTGFSWTDGTEVDWWDTPASSHVLNDDPTKDCFVQRTDAPPTWENDDCEAEHPFICTFNIPMCSTVEADRSYVCSGHGYCVADGVCECIEFWNGTDCEVSICSGDGNLTTQCTNGRGQCTNPPICDCPSVYFFGNSCEHHRCFGHDVVSGEPVDGIENTCSGHGDCVVVGSGSSSQTQCECSPDFVGSECEWAYCFGVNATTDAEGVCSGHGQCVSVGYGVSSQTRCECSSGWVGPECEMAQCYGINASSVGIVCGGHGTCNGVNSSSGPPKCVCDDGYGGSAACALDVSVGWESILPVVLSVVAVLGLVVGGGVVIAVLLVLRRSCNNSAPKSDNSGGEGEELKDVIGDNLSAEDAKLMTPKPTQTPYSEPVAPRASLQIDTRLFEVPFDELELVKHISEGSDASLFVARWSAATVVAVKMFRAPFVQATQDHNAFENEARVMASISHPNILRFLGVSLDPPRVGIVMEYCPEGDLASYISTHQDEPLPSEECLQLIVGITQALSYLHCRSILHRDIKPENILLKREDGLLTPKTMDFGLSRIIERSDMRNATRRLGTQLYMAPEMALGLTYDEKIDVFALGITMWVIWNWNLRPYGRDYDVAIDVQVATNPKVRPDVSTIRLDEAWCWVVDIMERCWAHAPEDRPSCEEVRKTIQQRMHQWD